MFGSALPPDVRRWLCPAVQRSFRFLGFALGAAFGPIDPKGLSPNQGHSPGIIWLLSAGHSHRLTSGGKAEAHQRRTLRAKLIFFELDRVYKCLHELVADAGEGARGPKNQVAIARTDDISRPIAVCCPLPLIYYRPRSTY